MGIARIALPPKPRALNVLRCREGWDMQRMQDSCAVSFTFNGGLSSNCNADPPVCRGGANGHG